jgi:hypothetical protein
MSHVPFEPGAHDDLAGWITDLVDDTPEDPALVVDDDAWGAENDGGEPGPSFGPDDDPMAPVGADADPDGVGADADADGVGPINDLERSSEAGDDTTGGDDDDPGIPWITLADLEDQDVTGTDPGEAGGPDLGAVLGLGSDLAGASLEPSALDALLDRLGVDDDVVGGGVQGRAAVQVLGAMGVDAHVTHGSVEELADRLADGERIAVAGPDGSRHLVVGVDFDHGSLLLEDVGATHAVSLADFAERWSGSAFEMVVATDGRDGGVHVLLPIVVELGGA